MMIRMAARGVKNGKSVHVVVLGLSHSNLDRLRDGQPIKFDGAELGLPEGTEIMIFAGETERAMQRDVVDLIGPGTQTKIDPRLQD
jgi:hypothetical protein